MKKSLKFWLLIYSVIGTVLSSCLFIGFRYINKNLNEQYGHAIQDYEKLNNFYKYMEDANAILKNYLVAYSNDDYLAFHRKLEEANVSLEYLMNNQNDIKWRFDLLMNMKLDYEKNVDRLLNIENSIDFNEQYTLVLHQSDLILNTAGKYYQELTTKQMKNKKVFQKLQNTVDMFTVIIILFMLGVILVLVFIINHVLTKPLGIITKNIQNIKAGNFDLRKIPSSSIELDIVYVALQDMAGQIQRNQEREKEINKLEKKFLEIENQNLKKRDQVFQSELYILQCQINPHFLFNTMNMNFISACEENAVLTSKLMEKTCDVFRYALDILKHPSDLKSEINEMESFLYIQRKRIGKRIHFCLDIEECLPNIRFPGMIIQPLVENAIMHGLKECIANGEIDINIYQHSHMLFIGVSDNGKGMNNRELEELLLSIDADQYVERKLGLYHVIQRIKSFYGDLGTICCHSFEGCGFEIIIQIQLDDSILKKEEVSEYEKAEKI